MLPPTHNMAAVPTIARTLKKTGTPLTSPWPTARDAVRRLAAPNRESHAGVLTVSVGLAVTNPQGGYDRRFFEGGAEALKKAQRKGLGYLHAVDLRPALDRRRKRSERVLRAA